MKTPYLDQLDRMILRHNPESTFTAAYNLLVAWNNFIRPIKSLFIKLLK